MSKFSVWIVLSCLLVIPAPGAAQKQMKSMASVINALAPTSATVGGNDFTLTVTGWNFRSSSVVQWNGSKLPTTVVNSTLLHALVGGSLIASAGLAQITVYTSCQWCGTSNSRTFTINPSSLTGSPTTTSTTTMSGGPLAITTTSVPAGATGLAFSYTMTASSGTPTYTWSTLSGWQGKIFANFPIEKSDSAF